MVFGHEAFIDRYRADNPEIVGIDIALPSRGLIEAIPRCLMGPTGALWFLERILDGMLEM